jgi:hypothetical protein
LDVHNFFLQCRNSVTSSHVASGEDKFNPGISGNAELAGFCAATELGQL